MTLTNYATIIHFEQILQNKENNEDKEITAIITGITHHEKQDDTLTQQKTDIDIIKQQLAELRSITKRLHSSQENIATIGAVEHYDSRRTASLDRLPRQEDSRVHFDRPRAEGTSHSQGNRDSSYTRGRDNSYSRSRDQSPSSNRDRSESRDNRQTYSRSSDSIYNNTRFREPRYNNNGFREYRQPNRYNPRFTNRPFRPRQEYGGHRGSHNNAPREWPTVQNNNAYMERTGPGNNQRFGQRDIVCHKCNKRGHIARECWTDMARINRPFRQN